MKETICDNTIVKSVVEHMNDDHSDACLAIARMLGNSHDAVKAHMLWMDATGVDFSAQSRDGKTQQVRVEFSKPITRDSQIRGHLVALTKQARALQE